MVKGGETGQSMIGGYFGNKNQAIKIIRTSCTFLQIEAGSREALTSQPTSNAMVDFRYFHLVL